ncbi:MAG: PIG-L family deacetylase [Proteobacteria bacterium]|nr:PIG-L family deacetylase [Pseudomonadota bacterium]
MSVLIIAAHPDDEALGCGGTIARLAAAGKTVDILFVCDGVSARPTTDRQGALSERRKAAGDAAAILGARGPRFLDLPDNQLDRVPLLSLVQALEEAIDSLMPQTIYTHHLGDLNIDHRITAQAVMTACRPLDSSPIREIFSFEVLSSTEWQAPMPSLAFVPNRFVDIDGFLETKLKALKPYDTEMRAFPHPRSPEAVTALATLRGAASGLYRAEAFVTLRIIVA